MANQISVCIPQDLRERAGALRINISEIARNALALEVSRIERENGGKPP